MAGQTYDPTGTTTPLTTDPNAAVSRWTPSVVKDGNGVYNYFNEEDDIILGGKQTVTEGFFTGNGGTLTTFFTSSAQAVLSSSRYYLDVYQTGSSDSGAEVQFDISNGTYGDISAADPSWENTYSASEAVYRQYASILLPASQSKFTFADGSSGDDILIINFKRDKLKEGLQKGYWQLNLDSKTLIDESRESDATNVNVGAGVGSAYYIVNGTVGAGRTSTALAYPFGIAYPDLGILVLNATKFSGITFSTSDTSVTNKNFFAAVETGAYFRVRNEEEISSTHYFVRAKNKKYNFSNNATWVTGSNGVIKNSDMWNDPKVYITTIGLYNDSNELLATAKLSKPVQKSFDRELLVKVRLDY